jgi:hypothetical protein
MKKILLFACFTVFSTALFAQSLQILSSRTDIIPGDKRQSRVALKNNGSTPVDVKVARIQNNLASGHVSNFCWDVCYGPGASVSQGALTIQPGDIDSISFMGDLDPNSSDGTSTVRYKFYNQQDPDDSIAISFTYAVGVLSIKDASAKLALTAYPNPADNEVKLSYNSGSLRNASVAIYNALGAEVSNIQLETNQGFVVLPVSHLSPDLYYYSLISNGKVLSTKKLTIYHR